MLNSILSRRVMLVKRKKHNTHLLSLLCLRPSLSLSPLSLSLSALHKRGARRRFIPWCVPPLDTGEPVHDTLFQTWFALTLINLATSRVEVISPRGFGQQRFLCTSSASSTSTGRNKCAGRRQRAVGWFALNWPAIDDHKLISPCRLTAASDKKHRPFDRFNPSPLRPLSLPIASSSAVSVFIDLL